jgi:hypothetical protein
MVIPFPHLSFVVQFHFLFPCGSTAYASMLSPAVPIARCPWLIAAEDDMPLCYHTIFFVVLVVAVGVVLVGVAS